jgi:hypothetical protein
MISVLSRNNFYQIAIRKPGSLFQVGGQARNACIGKAPGRMLEIATKVASYNFHRNG